MLCKDFSSPGIEDLCMDIYPYVTSVELFHAVTRGDSEEEVNHAVKDAKEELKKVTITCNGKDITCNIHVRVGDAADEIIRFSEEKNISLIVAKSTGGQGIVKKIVGGTTEAIARSAKKPLLILKKQNIRVS
jgi:nucleotide-binding universal stress UspA family protein